MIVITNDDGIDAPGLAALAAAVDGPRVIVAPREPMSECSHRVTTKCAIGVERRGEFEWAVAGTPADCVRVALLHVQQTLGQRVEMVLSGINHGGNLGADIYISGTVAAAREAAFFELPGAALSQYRRSVPAADWATATRLARRAIALLRQKPPEIGTYWNVNLPEVGPEADPPIIECPKSTRPLPVKYEQTDAGVQYVRGLYHSRAFEPGSDVDVCFRGNISATLLRL